MEQKIHNLWDNYKRCSIYEMRTLEGKEEKELKNI